MTRNRGPRDRRRRNRDRPEVPAQPADVVDVNRNVTADAGAATQAEPPVPRQDRVSPASPPVNARQGSGGSRSGGSRFHAGESGSNRQSGPQESTQAGRGQQGRGRRRTQRRSPVLPVQGEVLKPNAPVTPAAAPPATYELAEHQQNGEPVFGCPMMTRTKLGLPFTGGNHAPRCSLGWAIHSETEAAYCLETPDLVQCWKSHPERLDEIRARLAEPRAAD